MGKRTATADDTPSVTTLIVRDLLTGLDRRPGPRGAPRMRPQRVPAGLAAKQVPLLVTTSRTHSRTRDRRRAAGPAAAGGPGESYGFGGYLRETGPRGLMVVSVNDHLLRREGRWNGRNRVRACARASGGDARGPGVPGQ